MLPDYWAIQLLYFRNFGRLANLNSPKTLNEKINWRKLYQRDPRFTVYADKVAVKKEVAALIGADHVIPTLWMGENPEDIPFDTLPFPYVIKTNHGSGGMFFIRSPEDLNREKIIASMHEQLLQEYGHQCREWGYSKIERKILVERMIVSSAQDVPEDYKFFVYHGHVRFIHVDYGRFKEHTRNVFDRDWNLIPVTYVYPQTKRPLSKPENLETMILMAEKIGSQFDFARIDLYSTPEGVFFGEVTFYPDAGLMQLNPRSWDEELGKPWVIGR